MYESTIIISTFFISWSVERIYYYCFHNNNNTNGILNLNTPTAHYPMNTRLSNSNDAQYYSIHSLNNTIDVADICIFLVDHEEFKSSVKHGVFKHLNIIDFCGITLNS